MTGGAPQKADLLDALAAEIVHNYGKGRVIVAIDGLAGTAEFADQLAEAIKRTGHVVFRASMRNFGQPRVVRYAAGSLALERTYDLETLHRVLIDPFRDGGAGSFVLAAFDAERDAPIAQKWMTAKPDSLLIVDGEYLQQPALHGMWHYTVWLESPVQPSPAAATYISQSKPRTKATAIIDNTDPEYPQRVFADSC
jgi:uridine kinase